MSNTFFSFLVYSVSKSIVFLAPLIILSLLGSEYYVLTEQAISLALLSIPILNMGMTAAYPFYILEKKFFVFKKTFFKHLLVCILLILSIRIVAIDIAELKGVYDISLSMIMFFLFFSFFSIIFKCKNDVKRSAILDACPYVLILAYIGLRGSSVYAELFILSICGIFIYVVLKFLNSKAVDSSLISEGPSQVSSYYKKGFRCFLVSWISIAIIVVPRSFIPEILSIEDSEELYLFMRVTAVLVFTYQFLVIIFFKSSFGLSKSNISALWSSFWLIATAIFCVGLFFIQNKFIVWAYIYTLLWISVAFLELQVNRWSLEYKVFLSSFLIIPGLFLFFYVESFLFFSLLALFFLQLYVAIQLCWVVGLRDGVKLSIIPMVPSLLFFGFYT